MCLGVELVVLEQILAGGVMEVSGGAVDEKVTTSLADRAYRT